MAAHHTRCKARRLDDVEPDDVTSLATYGPILATLFVRPTVVTMGEPEPMSVELAGPMSAPTPHSLEGILSPRGRLGTQGPVGSPQVGVTLGYPSGLAGPIKLETQCRGQTILLQPDIDTTTGPVSAPSSSGLPGPISAAAGETTHYSCWPPTLPNQIAATARAGDGCSRRSYMRFNFFSS